MNIRKEKYLEIVEKLEKMQEVLKPRMGEIADAVVKSCVIKDLKEAKPGAIRSTCLATKNELQKLLINNNFLEYCRTRDFHVSDFSIYKHVFYFNINVWVNDPIVLPSVIIYGSDKEFNDYMKGFKANLQQFITLLRETQKKMIEEELIKKMVLDDNKKSN
jgi:hypothetical protein